MARQAKHRPRFCCCWWWILSAVVAITFTGLMVVVPSITAFTPFPYQASLPRHRHCSSSVKGVNKHSKTVLLATSSRDLKQQKAEEQQARKPRKKTTTTKRKTTAAKKGTKRIKMSNKMDSETAAQHEEEAKQTSLMERLQRATAKAKAAAIQAEYAAKRQQLEENGQEKQILSQQQKQQNSSSFHTNNNSDNSNQENTTDKKDPISQLGTLTQLMKIIDRELVSGRDGSKTFNVHGTTNPPPGVTQDSMRSLLEENERKLQQRHSRKSMVKHVAVIFSKSLINDMVTLEYACRLRALAKALLETEDDGEMGNEEGNGNGNGITYKPSVICFVGDRSSGNVVSDADAGYLFFRHLCQANNISLDGINMVLEEASLGKGALRFILQHLRQEYIPDWLDESSDEESATDEYGEKRQQPRKKIQLHFTFFSSDYDLCRLNDIHRRSPRQSLLTPLQANLEEDFSYPSPYASPAASPINLKGNLRSSLDGIVECSWSFCFAPYPYIHFADKVTAFLGKCYILAEELTPVLVNIRGVVDGKEFFQRDNYRVLVSVRRSFVTDMENFYQSEPSLKATLREYVINSGYPLDVVLEGVLLSLGRCLDLVRPAGLLIGYVSKTDWKNAEILLENAVRQLRDACDPDQPLDPSEWGKLECHFDHPMDKDIPSDMSEAELTALNNWRLQEFEE